MMEDIRQTLIERINPPFERQIWVDAGWDTILTDLHNEIVDFDPNYRIYQVKEKFGMLCFYMAPTRPEKYPVIRDIIHKYEQQSLQTCELTGKPGSLKHNKGRYKTLSDDYLTQGWEPA